jgi:hypothetical protein
VDGEEGGSNNVNGRDGVKGKKEVTVNYRGWVDRYCRSVRTGEGYQRM